MDARLQMYKEPDCYNYIQLLSFRKLSFVEGEEGGYTSNYQPCIVRVVVINQ